MLDVRAVDIKRLIGGSLSAKQNLISGYWILRLGRPAWSNKNSFQKYLNFLKILKILFITFEWKVLQRSDACQNDPKNKGYLPKTSATAFTMQKVEKGA